MRPVEAEYCVVAGQAASVFVDEPIAARGSGDSDWRWSESRWLVWDGWSDSATPMYLPVYEAWYSPAVRSAHCLGE